MSEIRVVYNTIGMAQEQIEAGLQAVLNEGADDIASTMREITSRLYPPASLPGEPPAERTGDFNSSIQEHHDTGPLEATVTAGGDEAPYGVVLEFGGGESDIAPRPSMAPAAHLVGQTMQEKTDRLMRGVGQ